MIPSIEFWNRLKVKNSEQFGFQRRMILKGLFTMIHWSIFSFHRARFFDGWNMWSILTWKIHTTMVGTNLGFSLLVLWLLGIADFTVFLTDMIAMISNTCNRCLADGPFLPYSWPMLQTFDVIILKLVFSALEVNNCLCSKLEILALIIASIIHDLEVQISVHHIGSLIFVILLSL